MAQKYATLARVRELESIKESFDDPLLYFEQCKKKPEEMKILVAHLKFPPPDWEPEKFGK